MGDRTQRVKGKANEVTGKATKAAVSSASVIAGSVPAAKAFSISRTPYQAGSSPWSDAPRMAFSKASARALAAPDPTHRVSLASEGSAPMTGTTKARTKMRKRRRITR